jgi:hypothetical protein
MTKNKHDDEPVQEQHTATQVQTQGMTADQQQANPPTTVVPPEGAPPHPDDSLGPVDVHAPVWEGGDPGTAVPSADDANDDYYKPIEEVPPETPAATATSAKRKIVDDEE